MNISDFKNKYPDLYSAVFDDGKKIGYAEGFAEGEKAGIEKGKTEGAETAAQAERERILNVEAQLIPGHEALIQDMKFDGKTTGEQAAVRILQVEKALRENVLTNLKTDAPQPVAHSPAPETEGKEKKNEDLPVEERAKAAWDKDPEIRKEFMNIFDNYLAFVKADEKGLIKILKSKQERR